MIEEYINSKFPGTHQRIVAYRQELVRVCNNFIDSGLADTNYVNRLTSGHDSTFWSCLSEAFLADRLLGKTFPDRSSIIGGPDFLVSNEDQNIWIEVICPEPCGVPSSWTTFTDGITNFPHESILLRWTAAIKEKSEKLLGNEEGTSNGYLQSGIVGPNDAYVIAINGCQLRNGPFSALSGISQFPVAAEAVFPIGPYQLTISKDTLGVVDRGHQHRPYVINRNGAHVPAYAFLDPRFNPVSAIWAVDLNGGSIIGNSEPMVVIHNPNAINPVPVGFLPSNEEYVATPCNSDELILERIEQ
ncbi:MAG: hypothetical protein ACOY32_08570 [Thermodesulfobacteriota bacterium]